jgi:hypothetical protein
VAIIDRRRYVIADRVQVPALEIGGICLAPPVFKDGCEKAWDILRRACCENGPVTFAS